MRASSLFRTMTPRLSLVLTCAAIMTTASACSNHDNNAAAASHDHLVDGATVTVPNDSSIPPDAESANARLDASTRHGEYVMIPKTGNAKDSLRAWVVYPERKDKAPVVIVVHEIFGLSTWVRSVADQLASEGYIAVAPDFLTGMNVAGAPDSISMQAGIAATSKLNRAQVMRDIDAAAAYATALPAAQNKFATIGFCWGGAVVFDYAAHSPNVATTVVYYGTSLAPNQASKVAGPVLGHYGENDERVNSTIAATDSAFKALGKTFQHHTYEGAGHGFLRQQGGANGANLAASRKAWPATIDWLKQYL